MRQSEQRGTTRVRRPPARFDEECNLINDLTADIKEPRNINEAWNGDFNAHRKETTDPEFDSLINNNTWELVPLVVDGFSR